MTNYAVHFQNSYAYRSSCWEIGSNTGTIEFWFKCSETSSTNKGLVVCWEEDGGSGFNTYFNNGVLYLSIQSSGSGFSDTSIGVANAYNDGNWHHFSISWDNNNAAEGFFYFIDGQNKGHFVDSVPNGDPIYLNKNLFLGKGLGYNTNCVIDELYATTVALHQSTDPFSTPTTHTVDGNTIAYYNFNEGTGDTIHDVTSHNFDLTGFPGEPYSWIAGYEPDDNSSSSSSGSSPSNSSSSTAASETSSSSSSSSSTKASETSSSSSSSSSTKASETSSSSSLSSQSSPSSSSAKKSATSSSSNSIELQQLRYRFGGFQFRTKDLQDIRTRGYGGKV
jgi:hypothetical protein